MQDDMPACSPVVMQVILLSGKVYKRLTGPFPRRSLHRWKITRIARCSPIKPEKT